MVLIPVPWNNRSHKFSSEVQGFHLKVYFPASNLYDIFAAKGVKVLYNFGIRKVLHNFSKNEHDYTIA
jgi:hypothetical protein